MSDPPPLAYENPKQAASDRKRSVTLGQIVGWSVAVLAVLMLLSTLLMPSSGRARESANRVKCWSCLATIGHASLLYSNENRNVLPPDLPTLFATQGLVAEVFTCPSSEVVKAIGPTTQAIVDEMMRGDHLSYAWAGRGLNNKVRADVVLAFDLEDHQPRDSAVGVGIHVLLGDGSVRFVDETTAKAIRAQFVAGVRPIRLPTATTQAVAK